MLRRTFRYLFRIIRLLRSLFLGLIGFILAGGLVIAVVEDLSIGDAIYFALITGLTIGYGDIAPATAVGRVIAVALGLIGILFTGLVVAVATNAVRRAWDEMHTGS
jgi:hypothetical protein